MTIDIITYLGLGFTIVSSFITFKIFLSFEKRLTELESVVIILSNDRSPAPSKINDDTNLESKIASGLIKGLRQVKDDDAKHMKMLEISRQLQRIPAPILNQNSAGNEQVNADGNLIPYNLSKEEMEILKDFYERK